MSVGVLRWIRPSRRADAASARGFAAYGALVVGGTGMLAILAAVWDLGSGPSFQPLLGPTMAHPLGTDGQGRDLLAWLGRGQLAFYPLALKACVIGIGGGVTLGILAGTLGGVTDKVIRYLTVVLAAFPRLPLLLLVATAFGPRFSVAVVALGLSFIPNVMSEVRQKVEALQRAEFIRAARIQGVSRWRVIWWHMGYLHLLPSVARQAVFLFVYVILIEAAVSFIGTLNGYMQIVGSEYTSIGRLLADSQNLLLDRPDTAMNWWPLAVTSAFLVMLISGWTAFGEALGRGRNG